MKNYGMVVDNIWDNAPLNSKAGRPSGLPVVTLPKEKYTYTPLSY